MGAEASNSITDTKIVHWPDSASRSMTKFCNFQCPPIRGGYTQSAVDADKLVQVVWLFYNEYLDTLQSVMRTLAGLTS